MLTFASLQALYLLLLIPLIGFLFWTIWQRVNSVRSEFNMRRLGRLSNVAGRMVYLRRATWFALSGACLIVALAEPRLEYELTKPIYRKLNVVFLLDTSLSMRARDISPSRLERAAEEIENFILHSSDNIGQIGLVSFSGSSTILSYLTRDPSNILFYLDYLQDDHRPAYGTDIGSALKNALVLLEKEQELEADLRPENVLLILISDGEDHGNLLPQLVQNAANLGLTIYCVGLGSELGGDIPIGERRGRTLFLLDESGQRVPATFDEVTLRGVAAATGGRYFRSRTGGELQENLNQILINERQAIGNETVTEQRSIHLWFILAGFCALGVFLMD